MGTWQKMLAAARLGPRNQRVFWDRSADLRREAAKLAAWAAFPRPAKCYPLSPWLLNEEREKGNALWKGEVLILTADHWEEIEAHFLGAFQTRSQQLAGTVDAIEDVTRRAGFAEAAERVATMDMLARMRTGVSRADALLFLAEAEDKARAAAAAAIRKLAEIQALHRNTAGRT